MAIQSVGFIVTGGVRETFPEWIPTADPHTSHSEGTISVHTGHDAQDDFFLVRSNFPGIFHTITSKFSDIETNNSPNK